MLFLYSLSCVFPLLFSPPNRSAAPGAEIYQSSPAPVEWFGATGTPANEVVSVFLPLFFCWRFHNGFTITEICVLFSCSVVSSFPSSIPNQFCVLLGFAKRKLSNFIIHFRSPSHKNFRRPGHLLRGWSPEVQAVWMVVHMLPTPAIAGDAEKRSSADINLESAVTSVSGSAVDTVPKIPISVFVQGVQVFHSAPPIS